jgi:ATP-dependent Clp protease protease subunit
MEEHINIILPEGMTMDEDKSVLPNPDEVLYWNNYKNRTFYIDYEIEDDYELLELSKIIVQFNMNEINIPEEELKPIYLFIHSYGGDLEQANYFCDLIESSRIPIYTIAMGAAMSAGFLIFLSGKRRFVFNHTQLLVHSGSGVLQGTAEQIEEAQKNYQRQIDGMRDFILSHTTIDAKTFNKNKKKDWYLTTEEIVKYNVGEIIHSFTDFYNIKTKE